MGISPAETIAWQIAADQVMLLLKMVHVPLVTTPVLVTAFAGSDVRYAWRKELLRHRTPGYSTPLKGDWHAASF